jgi:lysophospholipase L1-like esterase
MKLRLISVAILTSLMGAAPARAQDGPPYYLALGDSLSVGIQPNLAGIDVKTNQGYVDDLYAFYRSRIPGLRLKKLGCSNETTDTMMLGGVCDYDGADSQLAAALAFLKTHHVAFMTIDIGANNVDKCVSTAGIDQTCLNLGIASAFNDLPVILLTLRSQAPDVPIFAMNYFDPFLALVRFGPVGVQIAKDSLPNTLLFNALLENIYGAYGVPVANVQQAFHTTDTTPFAGVPLNVLLATAWTWTAFPPPIGPNPHPNAIGYAVIAGAFVKVIRLP